MLSSSSSTSSCYQLCFSQHHQVTSQPLGHAVEAVLQASLSALQRNAWEQAFGMQLHAWLSYLYGVDAASYT
jgi:hypothetical protein